MRTEETKKSKKILSVDILRGILFIIVSFFILYIIYVVTSFSNRDSDINSAKILMESIQDIRISIDKYYLETGEFPDISKKDLSTVVAKNKKDKNIIFSEIYGKNELVKTPKFKNLEASNQVNILENFNNFSNNGGWNYNIKTGEIHANLPNNFFEQGIEWETY